MDRKDWNLLVIAAAQGGALSPVQLQKSLFLVGKFIPQAVGQDYYEFVPYNYGPFDANIYSDAEQLALEGSVIISTPPGQRWCEYSITQEGLEKAAELRKELTPEMADFVTKLVHWVRGFSFNELVRWIYEKYPEYRQNSVFQE